MFMKIQTWCQFTNKTVKQFTVVFVDQFDKTLKTELVSYGSFATAPQNIVLPKDTAEYSYTFKWDNTFSDITSHLKVRLMVIEKTNNLSSDILWCLMANFI